MNARGKSLDRTYLSIDQAEDRGFIHRDYIAHCLRWSHVCKRLYERRAYEAAIILDVGCGRELPMAKMLYSSRLIPRHYFGVDAGPIEDSEAAKLMNGKFPHTLWEKTNFLEIQPTDVRSDRGIDDHVYPNIVTCFEVLEHVEPRMCLFMLRHMRTLTADDARFFISTPCWNVTDCAANHVNEIRYEVLGSIFEREGFVVDHVYGTFASIRDYDYLLDRSTAEMRPLIGNIFDRLREYYDSNFLSCVFAPLFPAQSRNCLWELRKRGDEPQKFKFPPLETCPEPWSSSDKWRDFNNI